MAQIPRSGVCAIRFFHHWPNWPLTDFAPGYCGREDSGNKPAGLSIRYREGSEFVRIYDLKKKK